METSCYQGASWKEGNYHLFSNEDSWRVSVLLRPFLTVVSALEFTASAEDLYASSEKLSPAICFVPVLHAVCAWNCCWVDGVGFFKLLGHLKPKYNFCPCHSTCKIIQLGVLLSHYEWLKLAAVVFYLTCHCYALLTQTGLEANTLLQKLRITECLQRQDYPNCSLSVL